MRDGQNFTSLKKLVEWDKSPKSQIAVSEQNFEVFFNPSIKKNMD